MTGALIEGLLPAYDFREVHRRFVSAAPDGVWRALETVPLGEMPAARLLFALRSLPARLAGKEGLPRAKTEPVLAQMLDFGFAVLAEEPGREIVVGLAGRMWKRGGGTIPVPDRAEFESFDRPDHVKAAMNFVLQSREGGTWLETETRVLATDAAGRRGFARYWRFIRPWSGLVRRSWLRAVARRAERSDQAPISRRAVRPGPLDRGSRS